MKREGEGRDFLKIGVWGGVLAGKVGINHERHEETRNEGGACGDAMGATADMDFPEGNQRRNPTSPEATKDERS